MKKYLSLTIPLLLVLGINLYFRLFPVNFPQIKSYAINTVEAGLRNSIARDIYNRFPQYDPLAKEKLIKTRFVESKRESKNQIEQQARELYFKLKDKYQDKAGRTYLMELDCWHWARYVANVIRYGHPGDEVVGGKQRDNLMLAPLGTYLPWNQFLFYFSAFLYKIFSIFKTLPLFTFLFYLPLFFIAVFITVLFLFCRKLGGSFGAIISCLFIALSPVFMPRSCVGWFDMDILNLLFPVSIIWAYLISYEPASLRNRLLWVCFSSFLVGLFSFTWANWWFIFFIIIMYEIFSLTAIALLSWRKGEMNLAFLREHALRLFLFLLFSIVWVIAISGLEPLTVLYHETKKALILNRPLLASIWPNVFATVGELRKVTIAQIASTNGDSFTFNLSLFCLAVLLFRASFMPKYTAFKRKAIFILTLWFLSMSFATMRGVRFSVFLLIPLGISLGCLCNEIYHYFRFVNKKWAGFLAIVIFSLYLCIGFLNKANNAAKSILPLMDDTWYEVLNLIKDKTPVDSVLNSWWDFGDWFKVVGQRPVIFDGQSQDVPQAYWMARALLSSNEEEAMGILRMLNNGGNRAFEVIDKYFKEPQKSVLLLERILPLDFQSAKKILLDFLPLPVAEEVLNLVFRRPPNACFIVDPSMQPKISAISYLGNWNFAKVYLAQNFNREEKNQIIDYLVRLGKNSDQMHKLYQEAFLISQKDLDNWLSRPLQFYSGLTGGEKRGQAVFFANGFIYNLDQQTIYNNTQIPASLFVIKNDNFVENIYTNGNLNFSALVVEIDGNYSLILLDRELAKSLFVRLYYLGGRGLKHFQGFIDAVEGNEHIRVFKIIW